MTTRQLRFALKFILVILVIVVMGLIYALYQLYKPPIEKYKTNEFTPLFSIYGYGPKPEQQLKQPHDVAFDKQGNIYITDTGNQRVLVFSPSGSFLFKFGFKAPEPGGFINPLGITVDKRYKIYVADQEKNKVIIFNSKGKFLKELDVVQPLKPVVAGEKLYVASYAYVSVFNLRNLKLLAKWGGKGRARENLDLATGLAVAPNKDMFVVDLGNLRLKSLNKQGKIRWIFGQPYNNKNPIGRQFGLPVSAAFDGKYIYVVDAFNSEIVVLNLAKQLIAKLSHEGEKEGEFYYPAGIAYGGQNIFAIADKFNDRVQIVKINIAKKRFKQ